jgi:hypothetical protein
MEPEVSALCSQEPSMVPILSQIDPYVQEKRNQIL